MLKINYTTREPRFPVARCFDPRPSKTPPTLQQAPRPGMMTTAPRRGARAAWGGPGHQDEAGVATM